MTTDTYKIDDIVSAVSFFLGGPHLSDFVSFFGSVFFLSSLFRDGSGFPEPMARYWFKQILEVSEMIRRGCMKSVYVCLWSAHNEYFFFFALI